MPQVRSDDVGPVVVALFPLATEPAPVTVNAIGAF